MVAHRLMDVLSEVTMLASEIYSFLCKYDRRLTFMYVHSRGEGLDRERQAVRQYFVEWGSIRSTLLTATWYEMGAAVWLLGLHCHIGCQDPKLLVSCLQSVTAGDTVCQGNETCPCRPHNHRPPNIEVKTELISREYSWLDLTRDSPSAPPLAFPSAEPSQLSLCSSSLPSLYSPPDRVVQPTATACARPVEGPTTLSCFLETMQAPTSESSKLFPFTPRQPDKEPVSKRKSKPKPKPRSKPKPKVQEAQNPSPKSTSSRSSARPTSRPTQPSPGPCPALAMRRHLASLPLPLARTQSYLERSADLAMATMHPMFGMALLASPYGRLAASVTDTVANMPTSKWSTDNVVEWFRSLGLKYDYEHSIRHFGLVGSTLPMLGEQMLSAMHIDGADILHILQALTHLFTFVQT
eukprot:NODE_547_length_1626_cov_111.011414_g453_i0.p1 GENE.NODE_547_length_1626_cov_111.011414_g453_i0~~NODE_547_length_1626_cov_111.011414_g453_i0.p1  ORF type:complete len:409 (+),score=67.90 NODE_547_length_1626_cov_111.011414_g453_i0:339-1565(+)